MNNTVVKTWTTKAGLKAAIILVDDSHHCGYVEAPIALRNCEYDVVEDHIDVHGGITYAGTLKSLTDMGWLFGYDCAHWKDKTKYSLDGVWRDEAYCTEECESMASQLISLNINKLIGKV